MNTKFLINCFLYKSYKTNIKISLHLVSVWICVCVCAFARFVFSPFYFLKFFLLVLMNSNHYCSCTLLHCVGDKITIHELFMHCSHIIYGTHNHFIHKKILKMDPTELFTHLKIILLQCFQFLVFSKINCIQMDL